MEETVTYEQGLEQQDPIPKPKKLKIKDFAAKIKAKYPDYKDIDDTELTNKIITKYPEYKDQVDLTPETSKKKVGTIGFEESSLRAGNVLSQSGGVGGEEIPQIEMYTLPNGEMVETDPVSISRKYKELKDRKKTVTEGVGSSFGMGTGTTKEVEDEESQKAAKKLAEDFKGLDIEGINDDTQGLSDDLIRLYKNDILPDREENNQLYQRKLANIKWRSSFEKKLLEDVDNGNIDPDNYNRIKHGIEQLPISTGQGDYSNQRAAVKSLAADIREYGGENRDKLLKDFAVEVSKVYGNPDNKAEEKFKDSPESKYLNTDAQLGYQYLQDVSPDKAEQYKRLFIDPKSLKDNPDELRGYNHLMQTLEETGINLKQNAVTEELNSLNKQAKMNGGLTPEQIERATKLENVNEELSAKRNELDSKYPDRIGDKIDDAVQEVMGQKTSGLNYAGGKVFTAFRNTAQGVWEAASSPFMSDESNTLRELAIMGQSLEDEKIYHKTDKNKALQYDAMVIKPELQKEVDLIKNNNLLTDDQKEQKLYKLFRENTDKFGRVPIKGGKFNVSPSSIMYGMTDLGTSLLPFVAIEAATGGIGGAGAGAKFLRTFTAAAATTFHDEYAAALMEGKSQSEAYRSAMASTAINSLAMAGAGTPTEIRAMASTKTSAGKLIQSMSDDAIEAVLKKGTPKGLKAVAQNVKERLKATPEMLKQGVKTGAKFEAYMGAANAINGREQDFKRSLLAIGEFGILGAALGQAAFKTPTQLQKSAGLEFGKKPDEYIAIAESMKKDGLLTDAQLEQRTELIKSYGEAYKSLPKNLDEKQQREYLYETVIKNEATKGKSNLPPKQAAEAEHRAMVADYKRQIILDQPTKKELENRKKQLEKLLEPPEINEKSGKAETISESVKKNYEAEIEAIDTHLDTTKKEVKEEELPNLSQPIEGTDEKGVPIGENVPPETKTTDVVESEKDEIFYTGRGKKFDDLTKTKGDFIFFSKNPKVSEWYGGDAENVTQAKLDTKDFLDLTTQEKKSDFVDRNFTDKDIQELYPDLSKRAFDDRDVRKTYEQKLKALTDKYRQRLKENRFSGSDKEQKFLLNKLKEKGYKGVKLADTFFGEPDISYVAIDKSVINTKPENKPIEGVDEFGVPIGENVPPEVKGEPEQITQPIELSVEQKGKDVVVDEGEVEPKVETTKTEDNAIQVRNATEVPLGETPGDSSKMGEGVPQPEIPTQKGEVKGEEVKVGKFESKAREIAGKIKATELPSWLKIDDPNVKKKGIGEEEVKKALADATIKMGKLLDKGVEFGQAVKEAVEDLVNMLGEGMRSSIEKGFGEEYKSKFGGEFEQRRFTKQMLRSDELSAESKAEISKTLNYVRQSNAMSLKEAAEAVEKVGLDEAQNLVMNDASMKGAVRVTLGQTIIKKYNELSEKATDQETRDYYLDKSIQTANFVTERLATEPGQTIQAFSMWSRLSPEGQLRAANQDMARQGQEKLRRREKDINKIAKEFQKANEETAEEVVKSEVLKEEPTENISKGKQKIIKAKEKRASIIKKYKAEKGKNLFSSPTGLTPEGIEFVGNIAKTYLDEGVANLQVLVEKIINHLEEVAGKKATDEIKKQVSEEADRMFNKADIKLIGEALKDKKIKIADIVKKHYTVVEASKKKLVQKLMDEADMSQSNAYELAKRVEAAFDRIATRKKRNILYNEKARFDKINNTLNGAKKVEKKTVADDIIKYSNLGAFEGKEFADMMANKFGIGEISPEQAAKLLQLAKKVQEAPEGTPKNNATEDLLAYRANLRGNDLGETAQAVWYASVLSGYKTHEKNLVSTFFNSMGELTAEMVKDPKSIPYLIAGYVKGISHRGRIEAAHTLKTGYSPIHIKKIETPNVLERKDFVGGAINPGNWFKYVMRLMVAEDVLSFQGLKEARAYQLARKEAAGRDFNTWSKKGWDEVNKILLHTKERYDEAFETIKEEGLVNDNGKPTLEGKRRIYEIMENSRPEKMVNDSYGFAAHGTFNHESEGSLGAITNAVASGLDSVHLGSFKPARLVVPFTRIITNVVNNSLDYTPIGLIRAARGVRGFRSFEKNVITKPAFKELSKDERQRLVAKAAIGITSAVALQAMHQAGTIQITGGGTGDKQKDQQLRDSGWQEYSVKIGDRYYSYKYTPLVFMLGYMGNMNDAQKYGDDDEKTLTKKMEVATSRIAGQVVDMTWINSSATFLGALAEKNPDRQGVAVSKALASMTRGFIPFGGAITQGTQLLNSAFHANKKQADGAWQALVATIPIAQNSLNDKINALGDPIQVNENTWPLLPDFVSKEKDDPVWKFLLDKQGWVAPVNKNTLIVFDQKTEQDRPITSDEYYEFSKKRGAKIKYQLQQLLLSGEMVDWNSGETMKLDKVSPKDFNEWLSKIEENATEETKAELFGIPPTKVTKNLDINQ